MPPCRGTGCGYRQRERLGTNRRLLVAYRHLDPAKGRALLECGAAVAHEPDAY